MSKLTKETDFEIRSVEGRQLLKLTEAGLAKLGHAVQTAPALWQSLQ